MLQSMLPLLQHNIRLAHLVTQFLLWGTRLPHAQSIRRGTVSFLVFLVRMECQNCTLPLCWRRHVCVPSSAASQPVRDRRSRLRSESRIARQMCVCRVVFVWFCIGSGEMVSPLSDTPQRLVLPHIFSAVGSGMPDHEQCRADTAQAQLIHSSTKDSQNCEELK
jgi:hypothetical protein